MTARGAGASRRGPGGAARAARANPIRTRKDWEAARDAASKDPGAFHGDIARRELFWLDAKSGAWVKRVDGASAWLGFDAATGARRAVDLPADWSPWKTAFDESEAPFYRWFAGGLTNACFNEVDVHVLAGRGRQIAFHFEGDRWDPAADGGRGRPVVGKAITRQELMWEVAKHAVVLADLGLKKGDRIALNMPNVMEQIYFTEAAKRLGVIYTPVFGGFSAKTLSDRIHDAGARIVITSDGAYRNAQVVGFKEPYTDRALDDYVPIGAALDVVEAALKTVAGVAAKDAATIRAGVAAALTGEITLERADVMRAVGRAVEPLVGWDAATKARVRTAIAEALARPVARVERVVVVKAASLPDLAWVQGRDVWASELCEAAAAKLLAGARAAGVAVKTEADLLALDGPTFARAVWATTRPLPVDAEFPLFIIYTSGSTGKPKGVVHTHGGYVAGLAHTMRVSFDVPPVDAPEGSPTNDNVIYVVADPGWITGQSYLISAALTTATTSVVAEGSPLFPHSGRFSSIIERYGVTLFKAGSTFLKAVLSDPQNVEDVKLYDRSSLRAATFCAEPVSPAIQKFGMELLTPQYLNSYWATEHGGIVLTHFYGNDDFALAPDAHTFPLPWVFADVWVPEATFEVEGRTRAEARRASAEEKGELVLTRPYPYLARTVWGDGDRVNDAAWRGDLKRFKEIYFDRWSEKGSGGQKITWAYTQGDFACRYEDGGLTLHGRSDDVINTSGHRMGTEEIEGAILKDKQQNPKSPVGNAIVVGAPHKEKGTVPLAFILTAGGKPLSLDDERRLTALVREEKGAVAAPGGYVCVSQFPETRSGKYMRRFLKDLLEGEPLGDTTTLRNPEALVEIERAIKRWQARAKLEDEQQLLTLYSTLRLEVHEVRQGKDAASIAVLTISKPPVNALDERALDELNTVVEHLARREDVRVVVLTGAGTQSFVAGADVRQLLEEMSTPEDVLPLPRKAAQVTRKLEGMGKPVVAAINGVALGGGNEFQMAAHYRVAETTARFGQPEINLHLIPGYGGTQRLPRLLEEANGLDGLVGAIGLILGGRTLDADEAVACGLVDEVSSDTDALSRATALAREFVLTGEGPLASAHNERLAANARWAKPGRYPAAELEAHPEVKRLVAQAKSGGRELPARWALEAIRLGYERGLPEGLDHEGRLFAEAVVSPQAGKIGLRAFFDRRSAPLPTRARPALDAVRANEAGALQEGWLLPVGAPFYPGVTPIPDFQYALLAEKDPATGLPRHGDPSAAEKKQIIPVPSIGPSETLLYMLTSEINFNDIWAITGVPVSPFDSHDEDWHVTGSGGLGLVARIGEEVKREGRVKVGDLVAVFSGQSQLLSPLAGLDPMFADQHIQGYETPDGSHQQFMVAQGPQLHPKGADLTLEAAGSYILNLGTVYRALYTTLGIGPESAGKTMFVEGAATGTGFEAVKAAVRSRVAVTGLVSSAARAKDVLAAGARGAIDRKDPRFAGAFVPVPDEPAAWPVWEQAGAALVEDFRRQNGGRLADFVVSHAGETSFPRGFQLLAEGGILTFFGASSGYRFTFMGKPGAARPDEMLARAGLTAGQAVLTFYGAAQGGALDPAGIEAIEAAREAGARIVVCAATDGQRDFVKSLGFGEAVRGVFSVQELARREGDAFSWPRTMPPLPDPRRETAAFKEAVRWYQEQVFKPFASQVGAFLRGAGNPRGTPDLVIERAGQDTLALSSMLIKPHTGRVVYFEDMAARRYTFYAPQVWMRQRRIYLPTANIWGTHLSNAYEVMKMNELVDAGLLQVGEPLVVPFDDGPESHQEMWENRHRASNYVLNHALPEMGLKTKDELYQAWSLRRG